MSQFERLDELAERVAAGDLDCTGALSTGERLYVALAANSVELLARYDYTIAEALARLGDDWVAQLIERWRYRGNPKSFTAAV
jgi:hypothetical protein